MDCFHLPRWMWAGSRHRWLATVAQAACLRVPWAASPRWPGCGPRQQAVPAPRRPAVGTTFQKPTALCCFALILLAAAGLAVPALAATNAPGVPTLAPSPVKVFREVLVMSAAEREDFLLIRPPGIREPLEAKIREYLAMPPDERELRLQATELRHYLLQVMSQPATNWPALLAQIPEPMRGLVKSRLDLWQLFPEPMRGELLENEQALRYFTQFAALNDLQRRQLLETLPADERARIEADIARWRNLPEASRQRLTAQVAQFFDLNPDERQRALGSLSEVERAAMERTLAAFEELPPHQREQCLRSFARFAAMPLAERRLFLKKAEAWQRMTPAERQQWRELVQHAPLLPPLPEGFVPPAPPGSALAPVAGTNAR